MRLVSLTGAAQVSHPDHGDAEAGADGVFDVGYDFAQSLLKQRGLWRSEDEHLAIQRRAEVRRLQDPKQAAAVLADLHARVTVLEAENAKLRAAAERKPAKKAASNAKQ